MNAIKLARKYPQFGQDGIFRLQDTFNKIDEEDKGYLDEATAIKAAQDLERKPYDVVRAALKQVELDSSRRVELDDFVDVSMKILIPLGRKSDGTKANVMRGTVDLEAPSQRGRPSTRLPWPGCFP